MRKLFELIKKLYNMTGLRYIASSGIAFIVEYTLLLLIEAALGELSLAMELAAVIAWIIGSQLNFWINRLWVFKSCGNTLAELGGYYSLAGVNFLVQTFVLLELMTRVASLPLNVAKPIAVIVMFTVTYIVQKKVIFKKKGTK